MTQPKYVYVVQAHKDKIPLRVYLEEEQANNDFDLLNIGCEDGYPEYFVDAVPLFPTPIDEPDGPHEDKDDG